MKITQVTIHNFRGIHHESLHLFDYSLLVGPNNAGKSTVIDAIRTFYEKDGAKYKGDRDFPFIQGSDKESWVEIVFVLTDEEHLSLKEEYQQKDKTLRVRKFFQAEDKSHNGVIYGYNAEGTLVTERQFYGANNVQSGKLGNVVFIPAVSKIDEHTKLSGPSALRDLLTNVMESVVASSESYEKLSTDFGAFVAGIKTEPAADGRSLAGLESELNGLLESWETEFRLTISPPSIAEIIKTLSDYDCVDKSHGKSLKAAQFGSGFQRHFIYSLIQVGAKYVAKKPSKKVKDFTPSMTLILFEEPEAFLHPPQQEALAQSLRRLASNPDQQVICSTHSSHFVSRNVSQIPSIARLKRENGCVSICQVNPRGWAEIIDANQAINKIADRWPEMKRRLETDDERAEMEAVKYFLWLNSDRCGVFFANHVLLVEGPSEVAIIKRMIDEGKIQADHCGLYVLDCLGKYNIHRFMNLLSQMGVRHSVLYDDDHGRDHHKDINELIQSSCDKNLTSKIQTIRGHLETLLDVPPAGSPHRKPQHLLLLYDEGQIKQENLAAFQVMVQGCLPPVE